jgi:hypothetical protein
MTMAKTSRIDLRLDFILFSLEYYGIDSGKAKNMAK